METYGDNYLDQNLCIGLRLNISFVDSEAILSIYLSTLLGHFIILYLF